MYMVYVILSIIGNAYSYYFFAFHLFEIVIRYEQLSGVTAALSQNYVTLFLIYLLIVDWTYVFSIISLEWFASQYTQCNTLVQCFMQNLYFGIPSAGQLVQFLQPFTLADPWDQTPSANGVGWLIFNLIYYYGLAIILFNIMLSVIVDTFGGLRENRSDAKNSLGNTCFICSIDRESFQQKARDFSVHIDKEHRRLNYFYFFAYLRDLEEQSYKSVSNSNRQESPAPSKLTVATKTSLLKKSDENYGDEDDEVVFVTHGLSQLEEEVVQQINNNQFLKFFPVGRALGLEEEEDQLTKTLLDQTEQLEQKFTQSSEQQEKAIKQYIDAAHNQQKEAIEALKNEIQQLKSLLAKST